jgi:hypothetical protein
MRERADAELSTKKEMATDSISTIARAVRRTTQELRDQRHGKMADYVDRAADQLERLSSGLQSKDIGELFQDAQRLARRQPAVFVGSAFAIGLLGARFLKSSAPRDNSRPPVWQRTGADSTGSSLRSPSAQLAPSREAETTRLRGSAPSTERF